jgi:outer membrane protein assembly factor BamA
MNSRTLFFLLGALLAAHPSGAQTASESRIELATSLREQKTSTPAAQPADRLERLLDFVERNRLFQSVPRDGLGVRFGGIENGSGIAAGPIWRESSPFGGRLNIHASAAASIARDHQIEGGILVPAFTSRRLSLDVRASSDYLAQERFFGASLESRRADETTFALQRRGGSATLTLSAAPWLTVNVGGQVATYTPEDGRARGVAGIATRWDVAAAPALGVATAFRVGSIGATADWRDVPDNPRRGGRYHVEMQRYFDATGHGYSFNRVNVELEQHLSWWRRQRMVTLRALAVASKPDDGHEVPFYLQPTLGGSRHLRGFVTDRFRDRNLLLMQAEYGWDIWPFLNAVFFYERGGVAADWRQLTFKSLRQDYGLGLRLGSARTVAVRTDVAFGSGEGTRLTMRFSHAF